MPSSSELRRSAGREATVRASRLAGPFALVLLLLGCPAVEPRGSESRTAPPGDSGASAEAFDPTEASGSIAVEPGHVFDGDSLIVHDAQGRELEVRLHAIDAPERGQPFSARSRSNLDALVRAGELRLTEVTTDRHGRIVGTIETAGRDLGLAQIEAGLAWHFTRYAHQQSEGDRRAYERAQRKAQQAGRGLWRDAEPEPPWAYRSERRP